MSLDNKSIVYVVGLSFVWICICMLIAIIATFVWKSLNQQGWQGWWNSKLLTFSLVTMIMELAYVAMDWTRTLLLLNHDVNTMEWEQ